MSNEAKKETELPTSYVIHNGKKVKLTFIDFISGKIRTKIAEHITIMPIDKLSTARNKAVAGVGMENLSVLDKPNSELSDEEIAAKKKLFASDFLDGEMLAKVQSGTYMDLEYNKKIQKWYYDWITIVIDWDKVMLDNAFKATISGSDVADADVIEFWDNQDYAMIVDVCARFRKLAKF